MTKPKIALLTTVNSRNAGGLYTSVRYLGLNIYRQGIDIRLFSHDDKFSAEDRFVYEEMPMSIYHISSLPILKQFSYSSDLMRLLEAYAPDIIHVQGIWTYHSYAAYKYKKKHCDTKVIITPRGMLDPWAIQNNGWKKKIVGHLYEISNLRNADCMHALCKSEYDSMRLFGLKNPIAIMPNAYNLPDNLTFNRDHDKKVMLFVGRIHPKKGLRELLSAIKLVKDENPELLSKWEFRIAGWDQNGHIQELISQSNNLGLDEYVKFIGSVYADKKDEEMRQANAFVLTSFSEGLPMSVLEAWAYKLPVLMTDYCNIPEGFEAKAAIRVDTTPESIKSGLISILSMDDAKLNKIGENGYNLVKEKFTWEHIARQSVDVYKWLMGQGNKPEFVK